MRALHATGNTGTLSSASGVVSTTDATAVEIVGTSSASRTPLNMTLTSVSATASGGNPPNGIVLTNTNGPGASVGFVVNGDGTTTTLGGNASGGTISNTAGADGATAGIGVLLDNADEVTLRRMQLNDHPNFAIRGTNVANFHLEYSTVNGSNGTNISAPFDEGSIAFNELTGAASVVGSVVQGGVEDTFRVVNTAGTLDRITFDNFTLGPMHAATGDNGVFLQAQNNAVIKATVQNSSLNSARGDLFQFDLTHTATGELIFNNNVVNNQHPAIVSGGGGITLSGGGSPTAAPTFNYDIQGSSFRGARGAALLVLMQTGSGSATGRVENNTFGVAGVDRSCSLEATCIELRSEGRAAQTALIDNNQIRQYSTNAGIYIEFDGINQGREPRHHRRAERHRHEQHHRAAVHRPRCQRRRSLQLRRDCHRHLSGVRRHPEQQRRQRRQHQREHRLRLPRAPAGADDVAAARLRRREQRQRGGRSPSYRGRTSAPRSVFVQNTVASGGGGFVGGGACLQPANLVTFNAPDDVNNFAELAAERGRRASVCAGGLLG